jgi:hypothetical protein
MRTDCEMQVEESKGNAENRQGVKCLKQDERMLARMSSVLNQ